MQHWIYTEATKQQGWITSPKMHISLCTKQLRNSRNLPECTWAGKHMKIIDGPQEVKQLKCLSYTFLHVFTLFPVHLSRATEHRLLISSEVNEPLDSDSQKQPPMGLRKIYAWLRAPCHFIQICTWEKLLPNSRTVVAQLRIFPNPKWQQSGKS